MTYNMTRIVSKQRVTRNAKIFKEATARQNRRSLNFGWTWDITV
jgi:hypothetical protein